MSTLDILKKKALQAVQDLGSEKSVSIEEILDALVEVQEEIDLYIEALEEDL